MEKIQNIMLYKYNNSAYTVFLQAIREMLEALGPANLNVEEVFSEFCESFDGLTAAIVGKRGSALTHELLQVDKQRLKTWSAIKGRLKNTMACPIEAEQAAAATLLFEAKKANKVRTMRYIDKTVVLRIVCKNLLNATNAPLCAKLGIINWVEALQNENNYFDEQRQKRSKENAYKNAGTVADARKRLDAVYVKLITRINAMVDLGVANAETKEFILLANKQIKRVKALQAWRKSMRAGKKKRELAKLAKNSDQ